MSRTTYEVTATVASGGTASARARDADIAFDGSAGPLAALPGPADLLAASLAACLLKNVERFSGLLPFRYERASVRIVAEREEPPPRIVALRYAIEVVTDEPDERVELLHKNLRKFGTITNTLAAACAVEGTLTAVRGSGPE